MLHLPLRTMLVALHTLNLQHRMLLSLQTTMRRRTATQAMTGIVYQATPHRMTKNMLLTQQRS